MPPLFFDLLTLVVTFIVAAACYPLLIRLLRRARFGQVIQKELPEAHQRKAGTPSAGGVLFIVFGVIGGLISLRMHSGAVPATVAMVLYGALGLVDDAAKLKISQVGIPARLKFPLQVLFAIPIAFLAHAPQHFIPAQLDWLYWPIAILAITGAANGVNYSDGLDGLCAGLSAIALLGVALVLPGAAAGERAVAMVLVGGVLAFLVYNRHPARIIMGDTGSLGLGAALAAMALQQGWGILLVLLGLVFVVEVLSVIIQVSYFKLTGGRRVFRMTPIHLTFQLEGWSEPRIVITFWAAGAVSMLAAAAVAWAVVHQ